MISRPIEDIEWRDLEALQESGREEGPQLEYKSSFKGGDDFLGLNEQRKKNAVDSLAKEVISFLNASGGDLLVGVREVSNDDPRIAEFSRLPNIQAVADRIAQALASVIEPAQSLVSVRGIRENDEDNGILLIRVGASLRAPHRSARTREAFVRRGREAAPMAMDEIQDMTLNRNELRQERLHFLEKQFHDLTEIRVGRSVLPETRFHIRAVMVPLGHKQIELTPAVLAGANPNDPILTRGQGKIRLDVAFRSLHANWRPVLRGKRLEHYSSMGDGEFSFAARELKESGVFISEFACYSHLGDQNPYRGLHSAWLTGFAANVLVALQNLSNLVPDLGDSVVRFGISSSENVQCEFGDDRFFPERRSWPAGVQYLPDFSLDGLTDVAGLFAQLQMDFAAIVGLEPNHPYQIDGI